MLTSLTRRFRRIVFHAPLDGVLLLSYLIVANAVILVGGDSPGPLQGIVVAPLVLFAPGYAIQTVLFPRATDADSGGVSLTERGALSFVLSLVTLPVVGIFLSVGGIGLARMPIVWAVNAIVAAGFVLGIVRRHQYPPRERFHFPLDARFSSLYRSLFDAESRRGALVTVALIGVVCLWAVSFGYIMLAPASGESHSQLTLLTESSDGEYVATDYPREFDPGQSRSMVVGIENREGEPVEYTVVAQLQRVQEDGDEMRVLERRELDRLSASLDDGETWYGHHDVTPETTGRDLRLVYLLYRGDPPAQPDASNAYRQGYIWINVTESDDSSG